MIPPPRLCRESCLSDIVSQVLSLGAAISISPRKSWPIEWDVWFTWQLLFRLGKLRRACIQKPKAQLAATLPKLGEELGGAKDDSEVCNLPVPSVPVACLYCTKLFSSLLWQPGGRWNEVCGLGSSSISCLSHLLCWWRLLLNLFPVLDSFPLGQEALKKEIGALFPVLQLGGITYSSLPQAWLPLSWDPTPGKSCDTWSGR